MADDGATPSHFEERVRRQLHTQHEGATPAPRPAEPLVHWLVFASGLLVGCALAGALELTPEKVWSWWDNHEQEDTIDGVVAGESA